MGNNHAKNRSKTLCFHIQTISLAISLMPLESPQELLACGIGQSEEIKIISP